MLIKFIQSQFHLILHRHFWVLPNIPKYVNICMYTLYIYICMYVCFMCMWLRKTSAIDYLFILCNCVNIVISVFILCWICYILIWKFLCVYASVCVFIKDCFNINFETHKWHVCWTKINYITLYYIILHYITQYYMAKINYIEYNNNLCNKLILHIYEGYCIVAIVNI